MSKSASQPKQGPELTQSHAGFSKIVHWDAYEVFRTRSLVFLVSYNLLLIVTNICLAYSLPFGQVLATAAVIAGAAAVFVAIQFTENIQRHFQGSPDVRATIQHAEEHLTEPAAAIRFIKTLDGQLVLLAVLLGLIMVVQFWGSLH